MSRSASDGVVGHGRDARADRDRRLTDLTGDLTADPLRHSHGVVTATSGQQHDELVAAVARGDVEVLGVRDQRVGDLTQHRITDLVPVRVVDLLEVIDVEHEEAERRTESLGARRLPLQRFIEEPSVGQPGERIARRQPFDLAEQARVAQRERGVHGRLGQRVNRRRGNARVGAPAPFGDGHAEILAVDGDRGDDHVLGTRQHEVEQIVVDHPHEHRGPRGPRLEHERCGPVGNVQQDLDDTVVAHTVPHLSAAHEHRRPGEAQARARVVDERRHDVVRSHGAVELGAELDEQLELRLAVAEGPLVHGREQRGAAGEQQEGDRADGCDAIVDEPGLLDHARIGGGVREQQQQCTPHRELEPGPVRRDQRDRHHVEEHEEQQRAPVATGDCDRDGDRRTVDQHGPRQERGDLTGREPTRDLDAGDEHQVHECDGDDFATRRPCRSGDDEQREDDQEPDELEDEQAVGDR